MSKVKEKQNIPNGWFQTTLDSECAFLKGQGLSKSDLSPDGKNKCLLYGQLFTTYDEVIDKVVSRTDSDAGILSEDGDVLIPGSTTTVAKDLAIASSLHEVGVQLGGDINIIRKKNNSYDPDFLAYYLTHHKKKDLSRYAQGITIIHLYANKFKDLEICIPKSVEEQQKIAEILGVVDEEIEKTKEVIEATEKLKKGLMQNFFTRGIGHKKFKQTELGEIPESWEIGGFENLVDSENKNAIKPGPFGSALKKEFYVPKGYKIYGQEQVLNSDPYFGDYFVDDEKYKSLEAFKVSPEDLLISLVGTIGKTLIVPNDAVPGIINPRLLKITLDHKKADVRFVEYLLHSSLLIRQMAGKSHGGTMSILNKGMLMSVKLPIPSKPEQEEIAKILSTVDEKIAVNKKLLTKQTELKKGLMQDLLSGVKRVKV